MKNGRALTPGQLLTHVAAVRQVVPPDRLGVIGLRTQDPWDGPAVLEVEGRAYQIVRADSPLAVREALQEAAGQEALTVLLTALEPDQLGLDLLARLAGGRLFAIDLWETVRGLFRARQIDPTVRGKSIARALLDHVPPDGYPPVPAGVLDAATVWRSLCRHTFLMGSGEPDLTQLLLWAATMPAGVDRYRSAADELREALRDRLVATLSAAAGSVLRFIDSGYAEDALALAVVCGVIFSGADVPADLREAAARLERFHGNTPISPAIGGQLARAAREALREPAQEQTNVLAGYLSRADQLLREVRADYLAYRSDLTPLGLDQRLERFAQAVQDALARTEAPPEGPAAEAVQTVEELALAVSAHALSPRAPLRLEQVRMACRLVRWLASPAQMFGDFAAAARAYRDEMAYADWARELLAGGDDLAALSAAYRRLEAAVRQRRQAFNRAFADVLAQESLRPAPPPGVIPVEGFLDAVLVPLAAASHRLLLIVLDGMSWAVAHELLAGLRHGHWQELALAAENTPPCPLLAAIPSVTEWSRTSLLSGQLRQGNADDERRWFSEHAGLNAACACRHPPVLFHKALLTEGSRGGLADATAQAILNTDKRVVGVVVNAIDDRLQGAQQVRDRWTIENIRPLGVLLQAARDAGRVVILVSDHGHVRDREDSLLRKAPNGGERRRPAVDGPQQDELLSQGPRVRGGPDQDRVIVPWDEGLRYSTARNGYHGGVTPQEMLAPLILLTPAFGQPRQGLQPCSLATPRWWEQGTGSPGPEICADSEPTVPAASVPVEGQGDLFSNLPQEVVEEQRCQIL